MIGLFIFPRTILRKWRRAVRLDRACVISSLRAKCQNPANCRGTLLPLHAMHAGRLAVPGPGWPGRRRLERVLEFSLPIRAVSNGEAESPLPSAGCWLRAGCAARPAAEIMEKNDDLFGPQIRPFAPRSWRWARSPLLAFNPIYFLISGPRKGESSRSQTLALALEPSDALLARIRSDQTTAEGRPAGLPGIVSGPSLAGSFRVRLSPNFTGRRVHSAVWEAACMQSPRFGRKTK